MDKKNLLKLLNDTEENDTGSSEGTRTLLIDGLNLFFRNFAMMNMVNPSGIHIGGLGGFFRSLGAEIRRTQPDQVYVVFDGASSTTNRKNIISEYKSGREDQRVTNWEVFDSLDDEHDSKVDQIVRVIHYLKTLPVKTVILDKVEADDIIAYLCSTLPNHPDDKIFIVSSDKDFLQLVNKNVIVYRPMEKKYYTEEAFRAKYKMSPQNFILHKTLLGDNSDKIKGVKGLGEKGLLKKFPELSERNLTFDDIFEICEKKFKDHVGSTDDSWICTTRHEAWKRFNHFIEKKINFFGDYEDAVDQRDNFLFHSSLSLLMNIGLITPGEVVQKLKQIINRVKINSLEGYFRQIVGWREFIKGVYQNYDEKFEQSNFFNHKRLMKKSWYDGTTGIFPLDYSIKNASKYAWTHHIERLMIQSNIMNLCEIKPSNVYRWFMEHYMDSSEWVMYPNVYGMGLFSDGGIFSTKPYICGSSYFRKMMDFKKDEWCEVLDGLYWRLIENNSV